jgi:hypothetical protein
MRVLCSIVYKGIMRVRILRRQRPALKGIKQSILNLPTLEMNEIIIYQGDEP